MESERGQQVIRSQLPSAQRIQLDRPEADGERCAIKSCQLYGTLIRVVQSTSVTAGKEAAWNGERPGTEELCHEGTREACLAAINSCIVNPTERIYWLCDHARVGKSAIANTIAKKYHEKTQLGASFFFSYGGANLNTPKYAIPTLVHQLSHFDSEIRSRVGQALE